MHAAAKVMLSLGLVFCVIGGALWAIGDDAIEYDIEEDNVYEGTGGSWDFVDDDLYTVYAKKGTKCDGFNATMTDSNGSVGAGLFYPNIVVYDCDSWELDEADGFINIGYIGADDDGVYSMDSTDTIYIMSLGDEAGEAVGGFMAILLSWGLLCCGAFFLLLGGIFALTMKSGGDQVVVVQQQNPMMATPGMTHMAAPQYEQPAQAQQPVQHEQPVQYQQPPQGGL